MNIDEMLEREALLKIQVIRAIVNDKFYDMIDSVSDLMSIRSDIAHKYATDLYDSGDIRSKISSDYRDKLDFIVEEIRDNKYSSMEKLQELFDRAIALSDNYVQIMTRIKVMEN